MTPDQYRREGAEAMRKAALEACEDYAPERNVDFPTDPFIAQIAQVTHSMDRIRAIDVDEVLAGMPTAPDPVARLVETAIAEYLLEPPFQTELERMGRKATARGMMVRLGIYEKFKEALAAMETNHDQ